jgi:Clostripain family
LDRRFTTSNPSPAKDLPVRNFVAAASTALLITACSTADKAAPIDRASSSAVAGTTSTSAATQTTTAPPTTNTPDSTSRGEALKPWTVLVYSIADTDLEPFMMADVNEMGTVGTGEGVNMVALVDRAAGYSDDDVLDLGNWVGAKLIEVGQGTGTQLSDEGDVNTGDPKVLADFIAEGIAAYPAEQYALVISDHGASWPGVGGDESAQSDSLTLQELDDAIGQGLDRAGVDQLDLLGFDACLMATYEVATKLAPRARRLIASQELEPGHGWDYNSLSILNGPTPVDVDVLGANILDGYRNQAKAEGTATDITLSLIDLTKMSNLDTAVADLSAALAERAAQLGAIVGIARENTLSFGRSPDPTQDSQMTDLGHLVSQIGVEALDVSDAADSVIKAINDVVIDSVEGPASLKSTGLSVYFPPTQSIFNSEYTTVVGETPWLNFLNSYYGAGADIAPGVRPEFDETAADPSDPADGTSFGPDGVTITAMLDPDTVANITQASISYGIIGDDGSITFVGEEAAKFVDDGSNQVSGTYDLTTFTMTDGEDTYTAYLDLEYDDDSGLITVDIPMAYYAPEDINGETYQDVLLSITVEEETMEIIDATYYVFDEQTDTFGELTADPKGIIVPEVFVVSLDGVGTWEPVADDGLFANLDDLDYDFEPLPSGTKLYIDLSVVDFGGYSDLASAEVVVP